MTTATGKSMRKFPFFFKMQKSRSSNAKIFTNTEKFSLISKISGRRVRFNELQQTDLSFSERLGRFFVIRYFNSATGIMSAEVKMRLIETPCAARLAQIEKLYYEAFPVEEQKPFSVILEKNREGSMEILAAENNHKDFMGLAITARHRDLVLLDYFAISPRHRQGGVGSKVFRMLKERYAGQRFFLEIESTLVKAENTEQRKRRKAFYLKNGMIDMPFTVDAFGMEMEILADGCSLEFEEYRDLYHSLFGTSAHGRIKLKTLQPQASKK